jgi:ATP-dependent exoDNAse (exonuclease V) beta subunit
MSADIDDGAARLTIAQDLDRSVMVVAGPGTGKTTALVGRIVALMRTGAASMGEIAAITFTEAAAAELRQRVRDAIEAAAAEGDPHMTAARHEVDDTAIGTMHSFAHQILIEHGVDAGLPPGFTVLDDTADAADFDARWTAFADTLFEDPGAERPLVLGFSTGLRHSDLAAVARSLRAHWDRLEDGGLEYLLAAPRCDDHWPRTDPAPVIEALERARSMIGWCTDDDDNMVTHLRGTVTAAVAQLTAAHPDTLAVLQLLDTLPPFRCAQGRQENWDGHIADVRAACAEAEQSRTDLLDEVRRAVLGDLVARLATFTVAAAEQRRVEGCITFHDLLVHARRLVRGGGPCLAALRMRYRRLLIDEFQDTDPIQVELAARLTSLDGTASLPAGGRGALFVVGDPKQSIYRFRRADIELFDQVRVDLGSDVTLRTNFRSVPGIIDFVNVVFHEIFGDGTIAGQAAHHDLQAARLSPTDDGGADDGPGAGRNATGPVQLAFPGIGTDPALGATGSAASARGKRPPAAVITVGEALPVSIPEVRRRAAADAAAAVDQVVSGRWSVEDTTSGRRRPARWSDIAILIPARSSLAPLENALEDAGVPYRLEGAALLWGADEVRDVLAVLRACDDPADAVAVLAALRSPGLACGDDDLVTWHAAGGTWDPQAAPPGGLENHPVTVAMGVLDRLHRRRWWTEPSAMVAAAYDELRSFELALSHRRPRDHWHRLRWLQDQARLFDESPGGTMGAFLAWAELRAEGDGRVGGVGPPDPDDDAVRVMTIHGAKGLEFPVVVLAGLEREPSDGPRPPAVVWTEHQIPEVRAGFLRTAGYEQAALREQRLDALEQQRLLYVAMTRARDHLVLCLHHKQRTGGPDSSLAAMVTRICAENRGLWRRLPDVTSPRASEAAGAALVAAVALPENWEADRARMVAALRRQPVTTATAVAQKTPVSVGADRTLPASPRLAGGKTTDEPLLVGRAVHAALADLDLSTGRDASGRSATEVAGSCASSQGVTAQKAAVRSMVLTALASPTVARGAGRRHWQEVYVATPVGRGGVLEGFVDLLFEDDDGLVVVDYKTDRIEREEAAAAISASYRLQLAAYAVALAASTGIPVMQCVLVFIGADEPREHILQGDDLVAAMAEARQVADDLVAT